jgi:hypothetical protein
MGIAQAECNAAKRDVADAHIYIAELRRRFITATKRQPRGNESEGEVGFFGGGCPFPEGALLRMT